MICIKKAATDVCDYLSAMPEVRRCKLYGSLAREECDAYSDIDIEIDVSGTDNGQFVIKLPKLLSEKYDVIYYDYAASLAPEIYVVTFAFFKDNPFRVVDINCVATPHYPSVSQEQIAALCNPYDHALKMFSVYLKYALRGKDVHNRISSLYTEVLAKESPDTDDMLMLRQIYVWAKMNAQERHIDYLRSFEPFLRASNN